MVGKDGVFDRACSRFGCVEVGVEGVGRLVEKARKHGIELGIAMDKRQDESKVALRGGGATLAGGLSSLDDVEFHGRGGGEYAACGTGVVWICTEQSLLIPASDRNGVR